MKTNEKGVIQTLLVIGIFVALGVILYALFVNRVKQSKVAAIPVPSAYQTQYQQSANGVTEIKTSKDLVTTTESLDTTNTTEFDSALKDLDSASSGF